MGQVLSYTSRNEAARILLRRVAFGDCHATVKSIQENPEFLSDPCFPGKNTLLHMAARYGQTSTLSAILQYGDQVARTQSKGHFAAGKRDSGTVSCCSADLALAHHKAVLINAMNSKQQTPLIIAAYRGHADIVQILVNEGALIQVADKARGCTALHYAAMHGHVECVKILLCAARSQPRDSHMATTVSRTVVASDHVVHGAASLHTGQDASRRHREFINCVDRAGLTPLHRASLAGAADVVKLLCEHGADVYALFYQGTTPLHIAAQQGHMQVVLIILRHIYEHSDLQDPRDMLDGTGHKPYELAIQSQQQQLAAILQPDLPLYLLFDCPDAENTESNVPKLAAVAAQALKQQLCTQLDQLEAQASMATASDDRAQSTKEVFEPCVGYDAAALSSSTSWESNRHSSSSMSDNPLGFNAHQDGSQSELLQSVHHLQRHQTKLLPQHTADTADCPVCYEDVGVSHMLACQPCNHQLCVTCARHVCTAIKVKPAACPMCRANIHGFMLKTSASKTSTCKAFQGPSI